MPDNRFTHHDTNFHTGPNKGPDEVPAGGIDQENDKNHLKYYFHNIIFNNQKEFSMKYYDFGDKALSFNTYEDYLLCLKDYKQNKVLKNSTTTKNESIFNQSK